MIPVPAIPIADQSSLPGRPTVPTVRLRSRPVKSTGLLPGTDGPTTSVAPGNPERMESGPVANNSPVGIDTGVPHPKAGPTRPGARDLVAIAPTEIPSSRDVAEPSPPDAVAEPQRRSTLPIAPQTIADMSPSNIPAAETPRPRGYCNPPKEYQFGPNNNANPKGRPKGAKNHRTILIEELNVKVPVLENGRTKKMSKYQIGMRKMANRLVETGDPKFLLIFDKVIGPGPAQANAAAAIPDLPLTAPDKTNLLDWFFQKRLLEESAKTTSKADAAQDQPPAPSDTGDQDDD